MKTQILILAALLALGGCTSKSVQTAQDQPSGNHNFTIGQILKNRSFCDAKWSDGKNPAGDTIVEYACSSTLSKDAVEGFREGLRTEVRSSPEEGNKMWKNMVEDSPIIQQEYGQYKDRFLVGIPAAMNRDMAAIDAIYPEGVKVEEHAYFSVDGSVARLFRMDLLLNGKASIYEALPAGLIFPSELATPKDEKTTKSWNNWWTNSKPSFKRALAFGMTDV